MTTPLTLAHFYVTGVQDCANAFSADEFMPRNSAIEACTRLIDIKILATQSVLAVTSEWTVDDWQREPEELEGLDPLACFEQWRAGWVATAIGYVVKYIDERWRARCEVCSGIDRGHTCCP